MIVLEPMPTTEALISDRPPEGYTIQVALDPIRGRRRLYPAIDPASTTTTSWPTLRHERAARQARALLSAYARLDPDLALPDPTTLPEPKTAGRAQRLLRYLTQPFMVAEAFSSIPGESTPIPEMLSSMEGILG